MGEKRCRGCSRYFQAYSDLGFGQCEEAESDTHNQKPETYSSDICWVKDENGQPAFKPKGGDAK